MQILEMFKTIKSLIKLANQLYKQWSSLKHWNQFYSIFWLIIIL